MRFYVTGIRGQLGSALARRIPPSDLTGGDLPEADVCELDALRAEFRAARPDVVLHCAAMTDVDGCAREPERAHRINALGARNAALLAAECGAAIVYVSTNEVFDGTSARPYLETDPPSPINAYGRSKLEGEVFASRCSERSWIVRTSWLYGAGGRNFVRRIQDLADERGALRVVADEVSSPTWTEDLAAAILSLVERGPFGVYHLAGAGECSRFEFARTILDLTGRSHVRVEPILARDWPRASTPPPYAPLDARKAASSGVSMRPWRDALREFLTGS